MTKSGLCLVACSAALASQVWAFSLDPDKIVDVRLRAYTQMSVFTTGGEKGDPGNRHIGDFAQHRNFYNPELDIRLRDRLGPMADDFKFHFAWWGFYDGVYDYLGSPWNDNRKALRGRFSESDNPLGESYQFNDQNKNPRHIYATRNRINELYMDWTKDRLFVRVGRQAISWGESDTIALLDVSNPFDLTLGAPGFFEDIEDARIPLWTARGTYKLINSWGPVTQAFLDAYIVPGPLDTTVPIDPITAGVSPFSVPVADPQDAVDAQGVGNTTHVSTVQRIPRDSWGNTRWGARLTSVINGDYTVQGWFFRTFNQQPAPWLLSPGPLALAGRATNPLQPVVVDDRGFRVAECNNINPATNTGRTPAGRPCGPRLATIALLERRLESVAGLAASWYSRPVDSVIRTEVEYFLNEPSFIPTQNINARSQIPKALRTAIGDTGHYQTSVATADYFRFVIAFDKNFFIRALNPANTFLLSVAFNGSVNLSELFTGEDYRSPLTKPDQPQAENGPIPGIPVCRGAAANTNPLCVHTDPKNFEDQSTFEGFFQSVLRTDYMHGRLEPQLVMITDPSGVFAFAPSLTYRFTDNLLMSAQYLAIAASRRYGIGTFRGYDMAQFRVTYQLN